MDEEKKWQFIANGLEALYEDVENSINRLVISKRFFKDIVNVTKGEEPSFKPLHEIKKEINNS